MRKIALSLLVFFVWSSAFAASVTPPNGSLEMVYTKASGATTFTPSATVYDADATTFITWCESHYSNIPTANTATGCFNAWFDDTVNQAMQNANASAAATAAAQAAASAPKITITPAQ